MRDYEELLRRVLSLVGEERRVEIEEEVERRIQEDPRLTRLGALYVVVGEMGLFKRLERVSSTVPLAKLVGGLSSVNVAARVIGLSRPRRDQPQLYLRLGDDSGVIDAVAWGEAVSELEELRVSVGSAIYVKAAYTRERADGSVELHLGEQAEVSEAETGLPPLEQFFRELPEVFETRGAVDLKAILLGVSEERIVAVREEFVSVRDALLGWRGVKAELSLWREQAKILDESAIGRIIYVAGARWSTGGTLTTSSRTSIRVGEEHEEELLVRVERRLSHPGLLLCTTSIGVERLYSENLEPGDAILVRRPAYRRLGRFWALTPLEYERIGWKEMRPRFMSINDLRIGMVDVCVEGELASLSPSTRLDTKRGEVDFASLWLKEDSSSIYCKAWGEAVKMLRGLREGSRVALLFVRVVGNPWGERELYIGEDSLVLPLEESP